MENDELDVAILAAQTNGKLNQIYDGRPPTRIDPRRFLSNNQNVHPQHHYPNQPAYGQPPPIDPLFQEYNISEPQVKPVHYLPTTIYRDGKPVDLNQYVGGNTHSGHLEEIHSFDVPNYNTKSATHTKSKNTDSPIDIIMKELKSLKRSINKLVRLHEASSPQSDTKIKTNSPKKKIINDPDTESENLSEGIPESFN